MLLSDIEIKAEIGAGRLVIEPLEDDAVQSASLDLTLNNCFWKPRENLDGFMADITQADPYAYMDRVEEDALELEPGGFLLGEDPLCPRRFARLG